MGAIKKQNVGFTIIELLTVMSVIIILIGLLAPALNMVRRFAWDVKQKNQFKSIEVALETFNAEWDGYPPSGWSGNAGDYYCGSAKLCEAVLGQDLLGFNPNARFIYPDPTYAQSVASGDLSNRRKYLPIENARANRLGDLYPDQLNVDLSNPSVHGNIFVLCDVYPNLTNNTTGKATGMPVLYFKADTTATNGQLIYDFTDNVPILGELGIPWEPGNPPHPLTEEMFKSRIRNENINISGIERPYREDSFILLSAGYDGVYGTEDDIYNFEKQ